MEHAYKRMRPGGFEESVEAVERAVRTHGFVIDAKHDIGSTVGSKGFAIRPLVILEISPEQPVDKPLSLVLPCKINIYEDEGRVAVAALRPTVYGSVFPEYDLAELARPIEADIIAIVDAATASA